MFRSVLFWIHLSAGLVAGLVIAVMSFTGAVLAFENEFVEWAERDVRRVDVPAMDANRVSLDELLAKAAGVAPADARLAGVTVTRDPADAVAVSYGREGTYYVNPYTGAVTPPAPTRTHDFMHLMEDWHRRLAFTGDHRETGRAITGVCNVAFLVLAVTGLYLWWPRKWTWRSLRPSVRFVAAKGKYRDWNWHNVVGFWSLPVIIVLTATGMVISYRWASNLAFQVAGEQPPAAPGPVAPPSDEIKIERPEGARRLTYAAALARIQETIPSWETITLREGLPRRRGAPAQQPAAGSPPSSPAPAVVTPTAPAPAPAAERPRSEGRRALQPYSATVTADDGSPAFVATQVVVHPFTGEFLSRSGYAEQTPGRKIRTWLRFLHTGQALGKPGQFLAALACLGGLVLVYSGFALSYRRFFGKRRVTHLPPA